MSRNTFADFIYQLAALLLAIILVHASYVTVVRPNAAAVLEQQAKQLAAGNVPSTDVSIWVILKDYEQETEIILALWAAAIIGLKIRQALTERRLLERRIVAAEPGTSILPEDTREYSRPLQALPVAERACLLPRALLAALQRFGTTRAIPDASGAVRDICDAEANRLDTEMAMVRYIIWAIPAIGFIGTVRGIGQALAAAPEAVEGNITNVTVSLGVAFNSTLVALVLSLFIMFVMHQLQQLQERLVLDTQEYCEEHLIRYFQVRSPGP
ncbi:MAG: MotA/TolQ/ExbB proton channel family protein [Gammaproteobacteria bacterium]|nr:MotA/TolQ/ExbB proton channel family protein [Gammaproteobacteria bacterium]